MEEMDVDITFSDVMDVDISMSEVNHLLNATEYQTPSKTPQRQCANIDNTAQTFSATPETWPAGGNARESCNSTFNVSADPELQLRIPLDLTFEQPMKEIKETQDCLKNSIISNNSNVSQATVVEQSLDSLDTTVGVKSDQTYTEDANGNPGNETEKEEIGHENIDGMIGKKSNGTFVSQNPSNITLPVVQPSSSNIDHKLIEVNANADEAISERKSLDATFAPRGSLDVTLPVVQPSMTNVDQKLIEVNANGNEEMPERQSLDATFAPQASLDVTLPVIQPLEDKLTESQANSTFTTSTSPANVTFIPETSSDVTRPVIQSLDDISGSKSNELNTTTTLITTPSSNATFVPEISSNITRPVIQSKDNNEQLNECNVDASFEVAPTSCLDVTYAPRASLDVTHPVIQSSEPKSDDSAVETLTSQSNTTFVPEISSDVTQPSNDTMLISNESNTSNILKATTPSYSDVTFISQESSNTTLPVIHQQGKILDLIENGKQMESEINAMLEKLPTTSIDTFMPQLPANVTRRILQQSNTSVDNLFDNAPLSRNDVTLNDEDDTLLIEDSPEQNNKKTEGEDDRKTEVIVVDGSPSKSTPKSSKNRGLLDSTIDDLQNVPINVNLREEPRISEEIESKQIEQKPNELISSNLEKTTPKSAKKHSLLDSTIVDDLQNVPMNVNLVEEQKTGGEIEGKCNKIESKTNETPTHGTSSGLGKLTPKSAKNRGLLDSTIVDDVLPNILIDANRQQLIQEKPAAVQLNANDVENKENITTRSVPDGLEQPKRSSEGPKRDHYKPRPSLLTLFDPLQSLNTSAAEPIKENLLEISQACTDNCKLINLENTLQELSEKDMDAENEEKMNAIQEMNRMKLELNQVKQELTALTLETQKREEVYLKFEADTQQKENHLRLEIKHLQEQLNAVPEQNNNEELDHIRSQFKECQAEIRKLKEENAHYKKIMNEYESTLSANNCENEKLKMEHETATHHLQAMEMSFTDVMIKYNRCKEIVAAYARNESTLKESMEQSNQVAAKYEERYEALKSHAKSQLDRANNDVVVLKEKNQAEINKLATVIKRLEIKNASLQQTLDQKIAECAALASLCDEMTGSVPLQ